MEGFLKEASTGQMAKRKKEQGLWKLSGGMEMPGQVMELVRPVPFCVCTREGDTPRQRDDAQGLQSVSHGVQTRWKGNQGHK